MKSFFEYRILRHFWQYEYQSRKSYCHRFFRCCLFFWNYHFNFQVKQHYCRTRRTILQKYWSGCLKCETWFYPPKLNFPYSKPSLISIDFECWKDRSLIKQLVHELMTFKMLMEMRWFHLGLKLRGGITPPWEPQGGYYPLYPPLCTRLYIYIYYICLPVDISGC